ncbi:MAG TPA: Crp/Fnr family transcriptional regulator [Gammaproteobacteria bacterium]|nr:Crp/Fnr family transcriptional regulator [Gammaproteobacteria bacterium]
MDQQQEKLLGLIGQLSAADRDTLASFAEFLLSRSGTGMAPASAAVPAAREIPEPEAIPRPQDERVVAAVKRLSKSYFMLDKSKMLGATSDLVTQHIMQGRDAAEIIDELEQVFAEQYRLLKAGGGD